MEERGRKFQQTLSRESSKKDLTLRAGYEHPCEGREKFDVMPTLTINYGQYSVYTRGQKEKEMTHITENKTARVIFPGALGENHNKISLPGEKNLGSELSLQVTCSKWTRPSFSVPSLLI